MFRAIPVISLVRSASFLGVLLWVLFLWFVALFAPCAHVPVVSIVVPCAHPGLDPLDAMHRVPVTCSVCLAVPPWPGSHGCHAPCVSGMLRCLDACYSGGVPGRSPFLGDPNSGPNIGFKRGVPCQPRWRTPKCPRFSPPKPPLFFPFRVVVPPLLPCGVLCPVLGVVLRPPYSPFGVSLDAVWGTPLPPLSPLSLPPAGLLSLSSLNRPGFRYLTRITAGC